MHRSYATFDRLRSLMQRDHLDESMREHLLDLSDTLLGVRGARPLRRSGRLGQLHTLRMNQCMIQVDAA